MRKQNQTWEKNDVCYTYHQKRVYIQNILRVPINLYEKDNQLYEKLDQRFKQTLHKRGKLNGKYMSKKMFYLSSKLDMQIKTKMRCHFISIKVAKMSKPIINKIGEDMD